MSQHRFLVPSLDGDEVVFGADQAHQLGHVLRLKAGDQVRVFDGVQPIDFLVTLSSPESGRVAGRRAQAAEPNTRLMAYPALLQRDKFESVLQKLTELGVSAIVPVLTARGLVREPPDERRQARWRAIIREAVEQCGRGCVPALHAAMPFAQAIAEAPGTKIVAFEGEQHHALSDALTERPTTVSLFVGPEGGYTVEEIEHTQAATVRLVTLGPRILRTETASTVLAALVLYELDDLSSGQV